MHLNYVRYLYGNLESKTDIAMCITKPLAQSGNHDFSRNRYALVLKRAGYHTQVIKPSILTIEPNGEISNSEDTCGGIPLVKFTQYGGLLVVPDTIGRDVTSNQSIDDVLSLMIGYTAVRRKSPDIKQNTLEHAFQRYQSISQAQGLAIIICSNMMQDLLSQSFFEYIQEHEAELHAEEIKPMGARGIKPGKEHLMRLALTFYKKKSF